MFFPEDLIEAPIDMGIDVFGGGFGVCAFLAHSAGYLLEKWPILSLDLYFSDLFDLLPLAVIDDDVVGVLHEFGGDGFDFPHVEVVVGISDF